MTKTANPVTGDAGDTITFTVIAANPAGGPTTAFEARILDTLPADYTLNLGSVSVAFAGGAVGSTNNSAGNIVDVTIDQIPLGDTATITYTATVNFTVTPGQIMTNTANLTYTSLPDEGTIGNPTGSNTPGGSGASDGERDGSGGVNDYAGSNSASVTVDTSTPIKSIAATSEGHTSETTADTLADPRPLAVGEIVRYRFQVVLPEGTSPNIVITDTLPNGLSLIQDSTLRISFVADNDVTESPDLAGADNDANPPTFSLPLARVNLVGQLLTINLGTLINNDSDSANTEFVLLEFNALVTNTAINNNGDAKDKAFSLSINGVNQGTSTTVSAMIIEPELQIDKVAAPVTANPTNTITFNVNVTHTANSAVTAFDTIMTDTLPAGYTLNLASVTVTPAGGASGISNTSAGNTVNITIDTIPLGGSVQITYTATVNFTVTPGQVITNTANLTYTSLPDEGTASNPTGSDTPGNSSDADGERNGTGGVNDHSDTDDAAVTILEPDLTIVKTHAGNFAVGQNGIFTLTVGNLGPGYATGAVTVADTLPAELTFVSATGNSWTCNFAALNVTCSHPGPVAPGVTLPNITLTVSPNTAIGSPFTNTATVSTPGETILGNNTDDDPVIVTPAPEPDLTIVKTHTGNFTVGSNGSFTLTVTNVGTAPTMGVITVTDTLPPQIDFVSASGSGWTCSFVNPIVSCTHNGPLAIGASLPIITLTVNPNTAVGSPFTNTATVTTPGDNNPTNDTDTDNVNVLAGPSPDLTIVKSHTGNFIVGVNGTFTLTVSNVGSSSTTGAVTVTDTVPPELTFVSATGADWTCSFAAPTLTCAYPSNGVGKPLGVGASLPNITLTVNPNMAVGSPFTNTATVSTPGDTNATNNTATDEVTVTASAEPDLTIVKTHTGNFIVGTDGTFTLIVSNVGSAPTTGQITVSDTLPAELTFVSATGTGWTCGFAVPTLTCTHNGPLAVGASLPNITLTVNPNTAVGSPFTNTATVSTASDNNPANNTDTDDVTVASAAAPDLTIVKSHIGDFVLGVNRAFSLTVTNVGVVPTMGVITVTDTVPPELTFVSATGTGWTCNFANPTLTCTHNGPVAAGGNLPVITLTVNANAVGNFVNAASVNTPGDINPTNNADTEDVTVVATGEPDLTILKTHTQDFTVGQQGTYQLLVTNVGSAITTGTITVTDTLQTGLTLVSASGTGWTCSAVGQDVACTHPGPLDVGNSLPPISLIVDVDAPALGVFNNIGIVSTPGDNNPANDRDDDQTIVNGPDVFDPPLVRKTVNAAGFPELEWRIFIINNTNPPATALTVRLVDPIPMGTTYVVGSINCLAQGASVVTLCQFDAVNNQIVLEASVASDPPGATTEAAAANEAVVTFRTSVLTGITQVNNTARLFWDADDDGDVNDNIAAGQSPLIATAQWQQAGTTNPPADSGAATIPADIYIAKQVDPPFALPGDKATWIIIVTNPSPVAVSNVVMQDTLPDGLTILSVSASSGIVTFAGQVVTFTQPILDSGQNVIITVTAEIARNVQIPFILTNNACVSVAEIANQRCAQATVISAANLPETGESPQMRYTVTLIATLCIGIAVRRLVKRSNELTPK